MIMLLDSSGKDVSQRVTIETHIFKFHVSK
jgi:hypothetical protein